MFCYGPVALLPRKSSEHDVCGPARDTLLSNRNTEKLKFDSNNVIFRGVSSPVHSLRADGVILIKFISRNVPQKLHAPIKGMKNVVF